MLPKLAFRNIRRSVRDYAIYFITLTIGVAVFYAFNSIGSQEILFDLESAADKRQFEMTQMFLSMFSTLIACVMGFLVLYANRFLIRRRKKEFGTYLLLGMRAVSVSAIVLLETVTVGLIALALGIGVGFLLSQALSFLTAGLFGVVIMNYQFVFSTEALLTTLECFAVIFIVVALFNTLTVSRCKLIDLLAADKKNEKGGVRNPWVCLLVFILALGCLAYAYEQLWENGMVMLDEPEFMRATIFMLIGSLLFFWSLAGFVIAILTRVRGIYLRGLSMFTVRQVASKINTAFLSLWVVCIMLFFSITTFSCGMGLVQAFTGNIEEANPYSATLRADVWAETPMDQVRPQSESISARAEQMEAQAPDRWELAQKYDWQMADALRAAAPAEWDQLVEGYAQVDTYEVPGVTYQTLIDDVYEENPDIEIKAEVEAVGRSNLQIIPLSQINDTLALLGEEKLKLADDECAMVNNMDMSQGLADAIAQGQFSVDILGHDLTFAPDVVKIQIMDNAILATALAIVVPDAVVDDLKEQGAIPLLSYLNVNYKEQGPEFDVALGQIVASLQPKDIGGFERGFAGKDDEYASLLWPVTTIYSRIDMISQANGMRMMITYLALYIGFVFLMSTATILAIQQLSEASDSIPRYRTLSNLGCDRRMTNRSLLIQVMVYFLVPLGLAVCHSAWVINLMNMNMFSGFGVPVLQPILMAGGLVLVIYGGYLLITYLTSRSIVNQAI